MNRKKIVLAAWFWSGVAWGQSSFNVPVASGYVTAVGAAGKFSVQGVACEAQATSEVYHLEGKTKVPDSLDGLYLGEGMTVWGKLDKKRQVATITFAQLYPMVPAKVKGRG